MKRLCLLPLILLLAAGAIAQVSTTANDVNAAANDTRLEKKVTLAFNSAKLEDVLKEIQKQTGIEFTAGSSDRDWRVRERKVTIYANDVSAGALKDQLAKLLDYRVSRYGKPNEWGYLFWQDQKSKQLEDELVTAEKAASAQRSAALRQSAIDLAQNALSMSSDDAMKLKATDPWLAYLGGTKSGRGFASLMSGLRQVAPTEYDLMKMGKRVDISIDKLPPELIEAVNDSTTGGLGAVITKRTSQLAVTIRPSKITFMPMNDIDDIDNAGLAGFGGMAIITGAFPGMVDTGATSPLSEGLPLGIFPITGGNSLVGNIFADLYFSLDQGKDIQSALHDLMPQATNSDYLAAAIAQESQTEKNPPTDPELTREIEIGDLRNPEETASILDPTASDEMNGRVIKELSRAFGMPIMLEHFNRTMPMSMFIKPGKQPLYMALVGMEKARYTWQKDGAFFRIRPEDWALRRSYEIPEAFLTKCKDTLAKQGAFTLDDIASIAYSLTDGQIKNNLITVPELTYALISIAVPGGSREILRVYGSMSNVQKNALKSENGLSFDALTNDQWDQMNSAISDRIGGAYIDGGSMRLIEDEPAAPKAESDDDIYFPTMPTFEVSVKLANEENPKTLRYIIMIYSKEEIEEMKKEKEKDKKDAQKEQTGIAQPQQPQRHSAPSVR